MANIDPTNALTSDQQHRRRVVNHVLRYELYRHRDISERLSDLLGVTQDAAAFNRSTWDILYFLMQNHLQGKTPNVTDIYVATKLSKGTAISGLAELERRGAIRKVRDSADGRRRQIDISESVAKALEVFIMECGDRLGQPYEVSDEVHLAPAGADLNDANPLVGILKQLSHELRTPLNAIVGFSEMIADETLGPVHPAGYTEYARDIRRAASHLLGSLNALVDTTLARNGGTIPLGTLNTIDMDELVDQACRAAAGTAERRGIVLRRKWSTTKSRILGDRDRLEQALHKLVKASVVSAGRNQIVDIETEFDIDSGLIIRVILPDAPAPAQKQAVDAPIGSPDIEDYASALPLIRAIVAAHGGTIAGVQDNPRRFVTQVFLPKDGPPHAAE